MNLRIILNALLIILIIHLLIQNLNLNEVIGTPKENFENNDKKTMNFLMNDNNENEINISNNTEVKSKLIEYIKRNTATYLDNDDSNVSNDSLGASNSVVLPDNVYESNENVPNFDSNVADIKVFYKNNFDNLEKQNLPDIKETPLNNENRSMEQNCQAIDSISKQACNVDNNASCPTIRPDTWTYKNELPMNGGLMNGIVGFDSIDSQYAVYDTSRLNIQSCNENGMDNGPGFNENTQKNDIRKPDIVN